MDVIGVVVIATNALLCSGIQTVIHQSAQNIHVIGSYLSVSDCEQGLKQTREQVDVLLLDDGVAHAKPLPTICRFLQRYHRLKIVIMSDFLNEWYVDRLLRSGAQGFLFMRDHLETALVNCIQTVTEGYPYLSPQASALPYSRIISDEFNQTDLAVLQLMDMGYKCGEIAERLNIVPRTVYRIRRKLCNNLEVMDKCKKIDMMLS